MPILILGGTGEARAVAAALVRDGHDVLSSLAGRVQRPRLPDGDVRIGGFGGPAGLAELLRTGNITAVIDATHPFAATISANAAVATAGTGTPRVVLRRPGWSPDPSWLKAHDIQAAARLVRESPVATVFLTTGRRDLSVFSDDDRHQFLVRTVDPPDGRLPPRMTLLLDRGPYTVEGELRLFRQHGIELLVTKDSGGDLTAAKLEAARVENVPVIMVQRPPVPGGSTVVATVEDALSWLDQLG